MKKMILSLTVVSAIALAGCTTNRHGQVESVGCDTDTNWGGAALGALGGAAVGSLIGGGTGNTIATIGGAAAGGYAGSKTNIGCNNHRR